ncbi:uncharacterized protein FOMMEDRAFT_149367 [Fomitiporia mediterranea MF3/22]|uniref:uncharacterized protein n=1 Tax=Fomitiporia mediterranea (strain MF3/22) TaxID=694068 RepID=UPI00044080EF|nr:uncharacterized protein FOMMEDRAFT_149367 [Fomitiporia mediterranea MF3/22]EJC97878.1 hypothetical protein FOMMEDRAFT_149367 [Fomitiporia mediterranea MF3/22]
MRTYTDFFGYEVLELIDKTLHAINIYVYKRKWLVAWHALDGLAKFKEMCDDWLNVDDGDHVRATEQFFGALVVSTLRGLEAAGLLNEEVIPELESSLIDMTEFAEHWWDTLDTCCHKGLSEVERRKRGDKIDEKREVEVGKDNDIRSTEGKETAWYGNADVQDANFQHRTFDLDRGLKEVLEHAHDNSSDSSYYNLIKLTEKEKKGYHINRRSRWMQVLG